MPHILGHFYFISRLQGDNTLALWSQLHHKTATCNISSILGKWYKLPKASCKAWQYHIALPRVSKMDSRSGRRGNRMIWSFLNKTPTTINIHFDYIYKLLIMNLFITQNQGDWHGQFTGLYCTSSFHDLHRHFIRREKAWSQKVQNVLQGHETSHAWYVRWGIG